MQPNLNMNATAKSPSDSRKRVRCDEIPATPDIRAKLQKSSTEQRSPDASDGPELSLDGMKDAAGSQRHWNIQPALPSCSKATTCDTPHNNAIGQVDNGWQQTPDDRVIFERLCQAEETAVQNILNLVQPISIHDVNAKWARMTMYHPPSVSPSNKRRISWSKKLQVTHVYEKYLVDTEYEFHEWLKNDWKKLQIEIKELRQRVIEALEIQIDLTEKLNKRTFEI